MLTVVKATHLPEIRVKPILVGPVPAGMVKPELKQGGVLCPHAPGAIAPHQNRNQVLQDPTVGNDPDVIAILVLFQERVDELTGAIAGILQRLSTGNRNPVGGGF